MSSQGYNNKHIWNKFYNGFELCILKYMTLLPDLAILFLELFPAGNHITIISSNPICGIKNLGIVQRTPHRELLKWVLIWIYSSIFYNINTAKFKYDIERLWKMYSAVEKIFKTLFVALCDFTYTVYFYTEPLISTGSEAWKAFTHGEDVKAQHTPF